MKGYTIHSFGYGKYHDENLMMDIAKMGNGNFYYIEQLNTVDEAFANVLG